MTEEEKKAYHKAWRQKNPDYQRQWKAKHPDYHRKWRERYRITGKESDTCVIFEESSRVSHLKIPDCR